MTLRARLILTVLILPLTSACKEVCCRNTNGTTFVAQLGCGDAEEVFANDDNDDDDEFADQCRSGGNGNSPCEQFCAGVTAACPSDTECLHSCDDLAAKIPSSQDIACAAAATSCAETNTCFEALF